MRVVDTVALVRVATRRRIRTVGEAGVAATAAAAGIVGVAAVILEVVAAMGVVGLKYPRLSGLDISKYTKRYSKCPLK